MFSEHDIVHITCWWNNKCQTVFVMYVHASSSRSSSYTIPSILYVISLQSKVYDRYSWSFYKQVSTGITRRSLSAFLSFYTRLFLSLAKSLRWLQQITLTLTLLYTVTKLYNLCKSLLGYNFCFCSETVCVLTCSPNNISEFSKEYIH